MAVNAEKGSRSHNKKQSFCMSVPLRLWDGLSRSAKAIQPPGSWKNGLRAFVYRKAEISAGNGVNRDCTELSKHRRVLCFDNSFFCFSGGSDNEHWQVNRTGACGIYNEIGCKTRRKPLGRKGLRPILKKGNTNFNNLGGAHYWTHRRCTNNA